MAHQLGRLYAQAKLTDGAKATAKEMFARVKAVFAERIPTRNRLGVETCAEAEKTLLPLRQNGGARYMDRLFPRQDWP